MKAWPETNESLILRVKDPADAAAWSAFLVIYRLARSRGLQDADAEDLAQQVLVSISRTVENWKPETDGPPFRAWLYRIAHNDCLKAITRRKPDAAVGSSSVQNMLNNLPQYEAEASAQLLHESRMQAFRWASEQVRHEFAPTTWNMFWKSTVLFLKKFSPDPMRIFRTYPSSLDGGSFWRDHCVISDRVKFNYTVIREISPGRLLCMFVGAIPGASAY